MTLLDRVDELDSALNRAEDREKLSLQVGRARDRATRMEELAEALEEAAAAAVELRRTGRGLPVDAVQRLRSLREDLDGLGPKWAEDPLSITGADAESLLGFGRRVASEVREQLAHEWMEHRRATRVPNVDAGLLEKIEQTGVDIEEIHGAVERARGGLTLLEARNLPREGDAERLEKHVETLREAVERLGELVPPEVREFIVAASSPSGAPLDLLTEQVRDFLQQRDLLHQYRVRQGR